jgi:hypothetical protein
MTTEETNTLTELNYKDRVAIDGSFPSLPSGLLFVLVKARTRWVIEKSPKKDTVALFSAKESSKKVDKARALGQPVFTDEDARDILGPPLKGFRKRFEHLVANEPDYYITHFLEIGDPAPPELLSRVEERVGFPLPEAARNLFGELNGLTWLWTYQDMQLDPIEELTISDAGDPGSALWQQIHRAAEGKNPARGLTCIPDVETIFFTDWYLGPDPVDPNDKVKVGRRKVAAPDFYGNLFRFDFFDGFYPCALWADKETEDFYIVYGDDHGATWEEFAPVPFEGYMEALIVEKADNRLMTSGGMKLSHLPYRLLKMFTR